MANPVENICDIGAYYCPDCLPGERAGIRGAAIVKAGWADLPGIDLTHLQTWKNLVCSGAAILLPAIKGEHDGGSANTVTGTGDRMNDVLNWTYTGSLDLVWLPENQGFFEKLAYSTDWELFIAGEITLQRTGVATTFTPTDPLPADLPTQRRHVIGFEFNVPHMMKIVSGAENVVAELFKSCELSKKTLSCYECHPIDPGTCFFVDSGGELELVAAAPDFTVETVPRYDS